VNPVAPCLVCGCSESNGAATHALVATVQAGDLDRAITLGLLHCHPCAGCNAACTEILLAARDARLSALAARERYRAREARLQRRAAELATKRAPAIPVDAPVTAAPPTLPPAVAAALARAQAKAAERRKP
jgi:hypothetical protein